MEWGALSRGALQSQRHRAERRRAVGAKARVHGVERLLDACAGGRFLLRPLGLGAIAQSQLLIGEG